MQRREFLGTSLAVAAAAAATAAPPVSAALAPAPSRASGRTGGRRFGLDYAPHFGMFRHHAGEDFIEQLRFMHDEGFRALEDNGMSTTSTHQQITEGNLIPNLDRAWDEIAYIQVGDNPGATSRPPAKSTT